MVVIEYSTIIIVRKPQNSIGNYYKAPILNPYNTPESNHCRPQEKEQRKAHPPGSPGLVGANAPPLAALRWRGRHRRAWVGAYGFAGFRGLEGGCSYGFIGFRALGFPRVVSLKALVWFKRLGFRVREFGGWKRCSVSLLVRLVLSKGLISLTPMQAREFVDVLG